MKKIPSKNYYVVLFVSVLVVIISLYTRSLYLSYIDSIKNSSIFANKNISQINEDDFKYALIETSEVILYVSYTGDTRIGSVERKLYKNLENRNLLDRVIYWDVTKYKNKEYIKVLKELFPNIESEIGYAPLIIYIKNGEAMEAINSKNKLIDVEDLNNLLSKYEIE